MQAYSAGKIVIKKVKIQTWILCVAFFFFFGFFCLFLSYSFFFFLDPALPSQAPAFNTFPLGNHSGGYDY